MKLCAPTESQRVLHIHGLNISLINGTQLILEKVGLHLIFLKIVFIYFRERGREKQRGGEKHQHVRETSIGCLSHSSSPGPQPGPQPRYVP